MFLGNLSYRATEAAIQELLAEAGTVLAVFLPTDPATGRAKGYAFVEMGSPGEAVRAIERLNGRLFLGRNLVVAGARPRAEPAVRDGRRRIR